MDKNEIYLGSSSKQNAPFQKICPKNAIMSPVSE